MKTYILNFKIFLSVAFSLLTLCVAAQPKPVFLDTKHDFGAFTEESGLARCQFALVNEGNEPLSILSARATCGCTTPEYPKKAIAPGDTAYISVAYNPEGRPGRFIKVVYVETNGEPAKHRLEISGVVIGSETTVSRKYPADFGPLKFSKPVMPLGEATMGRMKTVYFEGYNRSADSLYIKVQNVPSYLDIAIAPKVAPPGEQVTIIAYITPHNGADYGIVEDTITLIPAPGLQFELPTHLTVKEDFSTLDKEKLERAPVAVPSTDRIEFGKISRKGGAVTSSMKLGNIGKNDLHIRRVYSVDDGISIKTQSEMVKKERATEIRVSVNPAAYTDSVINSRLQIITDDPIHPVYTVRILAEIED